MAKCYVLKEDVSITFTPDEIWELIMCCEGAKSFHKDIMSRYPKGSRGHIEHEGMFKEAEEMQQKLIDIRNANGVLEGI